MVQNGKSQCPSKEGNSWIFQNSYKCLEIKLAMLSVYLCTVRAWLLIDLEALTWKAKRKCAYVEVIQNKNLGAGPQCCVHRPWWTRDTSEEDLRYWDVRASGCWPGRNEIEIYDTIILVIIGDEATWGWSPGGHGALAASVPRFTGREHGQPRRFLRARDLATSGRAGARV